MESLPPKPKHGEDCNGCGLCCVMVQCSISTAIFGDLDREVCPALIWSPEPFRSYCGLVVRPDLFMEQVYAAGLAPSDCPAMVFGFFVNYQLGVGKGCDAEDTPEILALQDRLQSAWGSIPITPLRIAGNESEDIDTSADFKD